MKELLLPERVAAAALGAAVEWAKTPGRKTRIAHRLSEITGRSVSRQMVEKWLHPEPEKRREPLLGIGLSLMVVASDLAATDDNRPGLINPAAKPGAALVTVEFSITQPSPTKPKSKPKTKPLK